MNDTDSPRQLRLSLAAAMELGLKPGLFYRGARLHCINLLLTYQSGCRASCAFCGLSRKNQGREPERGKFIRVDWPTHDTDTIIERLRQAARGDVVRRVCVSMVTHPRAMADTLTVCHRLRQEVDLPVSALVAPSVMDMDDLWDLRDAGVERVGVAIDCATPGLFSRLRGRPAGGPHDWDHYWHIYQEALGVFGPGMAGVHFICGLGETEQELAKSIQLARNLGGSTHLFSFFPEAFSRLAEQSPPPMDQYRRIQVARWLIDHDLAWEHDFSYDEDGAIASFGLPGHVLDEVLADGRCFMTSGCPGRGLEAACNRPYANERPGPDIRNYPFPPTEDDKAKCRAELWPDAARKKQAV